MKIGIPKEIKDHEYRVGMIPAGVHALVESGHEVFVQEKAGIGSGISDQEYIGAGARMVPDAATAYDDVTAEKSQLRFHEGWKLMPFFLGTKEP